MNAWKQSPAMLLKNNNSSFYTRAQKVPSLTGFKSRSGSITMDNAQEELAAFKGHISGHVPMLDLTSPMTPNESYSLLLKKAQPEAQSPMSSTGQLSVRERQTSLGKDYMILPKSTEREPKIIITPVTERLEQVHMDSFSPKVSMARASPFSAKSGSVAKKLSVYLKRKITGDMEDTGSLDSSKHQMEDPLVRKAVSSARYRSTRSESGRLLSIIAKQAIVGTNHEIAKILHVALEKSNVEALKKAKKEQYLNRRRKFIRFLKQIRDHLAQITDTWKPDSFLVVLWKIFMMGVILLQAFFCTYIVCFLPDSELKFENPIFLADFVGDALYFVDILSLFQIGYYYHGELCCDRSEIVAHYLATKFPLDIISMVSLIGRFLPETGCQYLILLALIRLYKLRPLLAAIEDYFQFSREASSVQRVFKLSGLMILLAHFCACGLYGITLVEDEEQNWIDAAGLTGKSEKEIYVTSLYWSVTTMTTVGFGDIAPITIPERIFVVGVMIISSIIFGYILSTIGTLLLEISAFSSEAKEKIRILTKYMNEKGLPKDVQSKIRKYLEFYLDRENAAKIEGDYIMKMLSPNLQEEIVREVNAKTIIDCYIFSSNFRKKFLYLVSKDLVERSYGPDETVFLRNDHLNSSVYFITSGKVDICYERCGISLQKLKKGACFGFLSFFCGKAREASAKSLEFTTLFELKREKFLEKLDHFESEKETYFMIKDSIMYSTNQYLDIKCYSCGSPNHIIAACPSLHFTLNPQEVIKEYLQEEDNFRKTFIRSTRTRFSTLRNLEYIQEAASQIQMGHQTEVDDHGFEEDELGNVGSYSSIDEILDRRIYDPKPLDYCADTTHMKYLDIAEGFKMTSVATLNQVPGSKRLRQKVGEIETFMRNNYDVYHHNLNIDRVKNFEVYYPMNNITKLMVEFEKTRLEKIVKMRLGFNAKHLSPLLVKTFRMNERKNSSAVGTAIVPLVTLPSIKQKAIKRHSVNIPRRDSIRANPSDILLYNNSETKASSSRFRHKSILGTSSVTPPYLLPPGELKKRFEPLDFASKLGRVREKDLSTIREDNTEKMEKGSQSNLSIGSPQDQKAVFPLDLRFAHADSLLSRLESKVVGVDVSTTEIRSSGKEPNKLAESLFPSRSDLLNSRWKVDSHLRDMRSGSNSSTSSVEAEPSVATSNNIDYSKLIQKFPNKLLIHKVKSDHAQGKSMTGRGLEKKVLTENNQRSMQDLKNDTNRIYRAILQEKLYETEGMHKRGTSEDNAKEAKKLVEKYKLPQLFKKLNTNNEEDDDLISNLSLKSYNG